MFSNFFKKNKNQTTNRLKVFLCLSLVFNIIYTIFLCVASLIYHSEWFLIMSIYYASLSVARVFLCAKISKDKLTRIKTMRAYGNFLFLINLLVSILMFILIYKKQPIKYHEITVITLATYTFYALTVAIVNGIKYLRKNDHVYLCVKVTSLVSASVSIVTLTNTMLATFGENNQALRSIILPFIGGLVSIFIIVTAVFLIKKSNLDLRKLKNAKQRE